MRIYFTASIVGKRYHLEKYQTIITLLERGSNTVLAEHILKTTPDEIRFESRQDRLDFHHQLQKWISTADAMVVEATFPSISVGYEISLALRWGKPVLVLYAEGDPPSLFANYQEERIICERYSMNVPGQLEEVISSFLNYVKGSGDTRFTFYLPSDLAVHLEEKARKAHLPKAAYLRKLIQADKIQ